MPQFFIRRPVFAWVIALFIILLGAIAIPKLPIARYPSVAPPTVNLSATYPGATPQTMNDGVISLIERELSSVKNLLYFESSSDTSGSASIVATFKPGTDPAMAQVDVQNKLKAIEPRLPQVVRQNGLTVESASSGFLMIIGLQSDDGRFDETALSDYMARNVVEELRRIEGVGRVQLFGAEQAMRIWVDPAKLIAYGLSMNDLSAAISQQNAQIAPGSVGASPALPAQRVTVPLTVQGQLTTPEQFAAIVLRANANGSKVVMGDVARVELGAQSYGFINRENGKAATAAAVQLAPGANAVRTAEGVQARMAELSRTMPAGMSYSIPFNTAPFVKISIEKVIQTLIEAMVLVFLVMYLFLQNFRATLIPTIAVPVVLLGTFGVLAACGFTINTLTMFAMVLAIGLLVDDAIVVVENVERVMSEEGLPPREATRKSMGQITGALIGVALVLAAVFVPMAFFKGSTGVIYRQFSITIVSAMTLSVLVAMVLTPALCATLLKPVRKGHAQATTGFFGWFNRTFDRGNHRYQGIVRHMLGKQRRYMAMYGVLFAMVVVGFMKLPVGFLPDEDQGTLFVLAQLPPGATNARTEDVLRQVEHHFLVDQKEAVSGVFSVAGFSFAGSGQNMGFAFVKLRPWNERKGEALSVSGVVARAFGFFATIRDARVFAFAPPAVAELGNATGFDLMLQDRANLGHAALMQARNQLLGTLSQDPRLVAVRPNGQEDTPEFQLQIDAHKAETLGLSISDINSTLATAWGSSYVNDFIDRGRVKKVMLQADAPFRMNPEDIDKWYVRNSAGTMVPFTAFARVDWSSGSPRLERYNGVPSMEILGMAKPGSASSGEALAIVEAAVAKLPAGIGYAWTGLSLQEKASSGQTTLLYTLSILIVFLCLAALYESWAIPFSVIMVVPLGVLGALLGAILTWKMNDVYFQVGLLTTIGLASKNAILIVEFAKELNAQGMRVVEAAMTAARMRLRPILMTSLAFILGVVPMVTGSGAGAGAQHALGTAVIGGMLSGTVLAIFFVPLFFVLVRGLFRARPAMAAATTAQPADAAAS